MALLTNYTAQSNAYPARWKLPPRSPVAVVLALSADAARIVFGYDCIVNYRGATIQQGTASYAATAPAFGLILTVSFRVSNACTFDVKVDLGDAIFTSILVAPVAIPASPPIFVYRTPVVPCYYLRGELTRAPGVATAVTIHASMTDY